jgi:hypothetical protein
MDIIDEDGNWRLDEDLRELSDRTVREVSSIEELQRFLEERGQIPETSPKKVSHTNREEIKRIVKKERNRAGSVIREIIKAKDKLDDWKVIDQDGETWLEYKKKIEVNGIIKNGVFYKYTPFPFRGKKCFVNGLKIKIGHPIITADMIKVDASFHANIKRSGNMCIGSLNGSPLSKIIKELPKMLEMNNLDSPYNESVYDYLMGNKRQWKRIRW